MPITFRNLALEGGGVWGIGYVGVLEVLESRGLLGPIERVAGTSAGSIIAMLVSLRYRPAEIRGIIEALDFSRFEDDGDPLRLGTEYGYYRGAYALQLFRQYVDDRLGDPEATFGDLQAWGGRDLRVFATDLATHAAREFSAGASPDVPLAVAIRASMSIPLFFAATDLDGQILVDGGTVFNYPIYSFGDLSETIGLAFDHSTATPGGGSGPDAFGFDAPIEYFRSLFETLLDAQAAVWMEDPDIRPRTILLDTRNVRATEFRLTDAQKSALIQSGVEAALKFFGADGPAA